MNTAQPQIIFRHPSVSKSTAKALKRMDAEGRHKLPPGTPMGFLPADWRQATDAADGVTAKHLWELCLADQMRQLLRSSDLSVPGSRQHKVWTSYLHAPAAWAEMTGSGCGTTSPTSMSAKKQQRADRALTLPSSPRSSRMASTFR